jgi:putative ABC transport system ATP-binding protein
VDAPLIQTRDLCKRYARGSGEIAVLEGIDLEVPAGEFAALMGPSGSGKTTLLNLLCGIETPTTGSVRVGEEEISVLGEAQRTRWRSRHVGIVFQLYNLIPVLTATENVEMPLLLRRLSASKRREQADKALAIVGMGHRREHRPGELSGGEQQRVAIARALVADPQVILADEPTGDLDAKGAAEIVELLAGLSRELGKSVVVVTHDRKVADRADCLWHLEKGRLEPPLRPREPEPVPGAK